MPSSPGKLIVISGPSGAGKTTLLKELYGRSPRLSPSVSATTRPPRPGERDGVDYYFFTADEFARRRASGEFLECFEVFGRGHWYGTLRSEVTPGLAAGKWVVLEIDVDGTFAVLKQYPQAVTIFIAPESVAELEARLRLRNTEDAATIERRLEVARRELQAADQYQHRVVNRSVPAAVDEILAILKTLEEQDR